MILARTAPLLVLVVAGCTSGTSTPNDASAEASDAAMPLDAGADSGVLTCVQPDNSAAATVSIFQKPMPAPAPMGGTPYPGLYQLTAVNEYGAMDAGMTCCARVAMRVSDVEILKSAFYSSSGTSKIAVTYTVNGAHLSTQPVCGTPPNSAGDWPFTAVGDTLSLYSGTTEEVYGWVAP